jgi:hypothetical protein
MKYFISVVIGGIDAYSHSSCLWNSMWEWDKEILYVIYKLTQIYLWKIKLYLSLSWVAFLTEIETAIRANIMLQVTPQKLRDSEKSYGSW